MNLSLDNKAEKLIAERVKSGKYATPEDVVTAALHALEHDEHAGEFTPGEWDALLAEGENSGRPLDGPSVLAELRKSAPFKPRANRNENLLHPTTGTTRFARHLEPHRTGEPPRGKQGCRRNWKPPFSILSICPAKVTADPMSMTHAFDSGAYIPTSSLIATTKLP